MAKKVELELMRPAEFIAARNSFPVAYVPVSPLEWHGRHMPLGTDALAAQALCCRVARKIGGVVHPTIYLGVDAYWKKIWLPKIDTSTDTKIVGVTLPMHGFANMPETVGIVLRDVTGTLTDHAFRAVLLVNMHGSPFQMGAIARVAQDESASSGARVVAVSHEDLLADEHPIDHAGRQESSMMMALRGKLVDLSKLGRRKRLTREREGITVDPDPRKTASAARGRRMVATMLKSLTRIAQQALEQAGERPASS